MGWPLFVLGGAALAGLGLLGSGSGGKRSPEERLPEKRDTGEPMIYRPATDSAVVERTAEFQRRLQSHLEECERYERRLVAYEDLKQKHEEDKRRVGELRQLIDRKKRSQTWAGVVGAGCMVGAFWIGHEGISDLSDLEIFFVLVLTLLFVPAATAFWRRGFEIVNAREELKKIDLLPPGSKPIRPSLKLNCAHCRRYIPGLESWFCSFCGYEQRGNFLIPCWKCANQVASYLCEHCWEIIPIRPGRKADYDMPGWRKRPVPDVHPKYYRLSKTKPLPELGVGVGGSGLDSSDDETRRRSLAEKKRLEEENRKLMEELERLTGIIEEPIQQELQRLVARRRIEEMKDKELLNEIARLKENEEQLAREYGKESALYKAGVRQLKETFKERAEDLLRPRRQASSSKQTNFR